MVHFTAPTYPGSDGRGGRRIDHRLDSRRQSRTAFTVNSAPAGGNGQVAGGGCRLYEPEPNAPPISFGPAIPPRPVMVDCPPISAGFQGNRTFGVSLGTGPTAGAAGDAATRPIGFQIRSRRCTDPGGCVSVVRGRAAQVDKTSRGRTKLPLLCPAPGGLNGGWRWRAMSRNPAPLANGSELNLTNPTTVQLCRMGAASGPLPPQLKPFSHPGQEAGRGRHPQPQQAVGGAWREATATITIGKRDLIPANGRRVESSLWASGKRHSNLSGRLDAAGRPCGSGLNKGASQWPRSAPLPRATK